MDKIIFSTLIIMVVGFKFINTQSSDLESTRKNILGYLKLSDTATARDICNGLQKVLQSDLDQQKKNGQSGDLPPNDPNRKWMNECGKQNVTMESLLPLLSG